MTYFPEIWWPCLNPRESGVLSDLVHSSILVPLYITKIEFQLLWAARGYDLANPIVMGFVATYYLTYETIEIPGIGEVEVVMFGISFWTEFKAFSLTPEFSDPPVCKILVFTS